MGHHDLGTKLNSYPPCNTSFLSSQNYALSHTPMPVEKHPVGVRFSTRQVLDRIRFAVSSMGSSSLSVFRGGISHSGTFRGIVSCRMTFEFLHPYRSKI